MKKRDRNLKKKVKAKAPSLKIKRQPGMGMSDREEILSVFEEALMCHVAIVDDNHPVVIPMVFVLVDEHLYLHGSTESRMMINLKNGGAASINATILDGLVLARSAFNHAMNYRSATLFGSATELPSSKEKLTALKALSEKYVPSRWTHLRKPNKEELDQTMVLKFGTKQISGKKRAGSPSDFESDLNHDVWAGEIPLTLKYGSPRVDPRAVSRDLPQHLTDLLNFQPS